MGGMGAGILESRILVLAPTGRDGPLAVQALARAGLTAEACRDVRELCDGIAAGAAAALIAEEALSSDALACLGAAIQAQPTWSDMPLLVFSSTKGNAHTDERLAFIREALGNVTFLERPLRVVTLISALQGAIRARRHQYEMRALLLKRDEEVRQRDHFLAMLGHELRNPLAAVIMASDIMARSPSDAFLKQRALIGRQARHLARLVDDLLDVSRVTTGKIALKRTSVNLLELVQRGVQAVEATIKAQRLDVTVSAGTEPVAIDGDPVRIEQIFTNLLTNAIKYTPAGGRITVQVTREGSEGVLRVRDNGTGIAPEMLGGIFELFTQVENTLDRARGGLGIGLTVARSLAQQHGGTVQAFSDGLGQGSEFVVRLPLLASAEHVVQPQASEAGLVSRHIVIVEDHSDFRELLQSALEEFGHKVEAASDGPDGVALLLEARPEVAIVDIGLPKLDGYGVARKVRAVLGRNVFLVALTGYGQPEDRQRAREAGFDLHMTKPLDFKVLQSLLARQDMISTIH
jgi:signal transduction histidine kinase/ActR/RegA family two-component response regulator